MAKKKTTAPAEPEETTTAEETQATEETEATEETAQAEPRPLTAETKLPCMATVAAPLAVLRKTIGPGTAQQLKPVATLKQGIQVTVKILDGEDALLANGLWTRANFLTV